MSSLIEFVRDMNERLGITLPDGWQRLSDVEAARRFLEGVNRYFFQTQDGIGTTQFQGDELRYFSEFHKFWEASHVDIIGTTVDRMKAMSMARAFDRTITRFGRGILGVTHQTHGLPPRSVAQVRFFTANQDFREPPVSQFERYLIDPSRFDPQEVAANPAGFLSFLGITRLSQTDKRVDFARNSARLLIERGVDAFGLAELYGNDARRIREALVSAPNIGYGLKKANMFVRDMVEMNVWPELEGFDGIDVASDINTMKLALRSRVLRTTMPLLSSFLDVFCYQYEHIDRMSSHAWRTVWEQWRSLPDTTAPRSPCLMDFLLYRIGREYCKDNVVRYQCERGHAFYYFGAQLQSCTACRRRGIRSKALPVDRCLPCQVDPESLPREDGVLLLSDNNLLRLFDGVCIFEDVCQPRSDTFKQLDPPKSISVKGQTSWTNSYAEAARGGGGMMG